MLYARIFLISTLLIGFAVALSGCESSYDINHTTRFFYKGDEDPYKSRGSGRTTGSGYTTFRESERDN